MTIAQITRGPRRWSGGLRPPCGDGPLPNELDGEGPPALAAQMQTVEATNA